MNERTQQILHQLNMKPNDAKAGKVRCVRSYDRRSPTNNGKGVRPSGRAKRAQLTHMIAMKDGRRRHKYTGRRFDGQGARK